MQLQKALSNVAKCFVAPDKIIKSKLNDELTFLVSITVIDNAIKKGLITAEAAEKTIKGEKTYARSEINDIIFS
jgi:hypothetical protein